MSVVGAGVGMSATACSVNEAELSSHCRQSCRQIDSLKRTSSAEHSAARPPQLRVLAAIAQLIAGLDADAIDAMPDDAIAALRRRLGLDEHQITDREGGELLTPREGAQRARVHVETIRRAIRRGDLPARRVGRSLRIAESDFDEWLRTPLTRDRCATASRSAAARKTRTSRRPLAHALADLTRSPPSV